MRISKACFILFIMVMCSCLRTLPGFAVDDGFVAAGQVSSEYFSIAMEKGVEISELNDRLNIGFSDSLLAGRPGSENPTPDQALAEMADILFLRVSDILDMRLFDFKCTLKICRDTGRLSEVYRKLFARDLKNTCSFYVSDLNTIYIAADHFDVGVLGHEIAHTVQSRYFVVAAPTKVQEVLAGYVEYQLRKKK